MNTPEPFLLRFPCQNFRRTAVLIALGSTLLSHRTLAQNTTATFATESAEKVNSFPTAPQIATSHPRVETSVSVGAMGQLTATRISQSSSNFITQSLSPSAEVFATFQQSFKPWLGYSANFGYTRTTYRYTAAPALFGSVIGSTYIPNNVYETSVSYIARKHLTNRLTAFGEAGGGAISFAAITRSVHSTGGTEFNVQRSNTFRPIGIAGFGMDYQLMHGFGLRAEYRGLFASYPDYASGQPGLATLNSEPTVSITCAFGDHSRR